MHLYFVYNFDKRWQGSKILSLVDSAFVVPNPNPDKFLAYSEAIAQLAHF